MTPRPSSPIAAIQALRAFAVSWVVLDHAFPWLLPGGFVGVDIFFVISGYLITTILIDELARGDFSILRFYERRARRILPALFATAFLVTLAGVLIFMPDELRDVGASLVASV